jgi:hypothetical protein
MIPATPPDVHNFHPEMALLCDLGVNLLDLFELAQNCRFPN